jgi:hypothetical protein
MKALFFDIDGTLVSFKTHKIPQTAIDALLEAKKTELKSLFLLDVPSCRSMN